MNQYIYRIDKNDNICFINDEWKSFAKGNDSADLIDNVLGKSLWGFMKINLVVQLYKQLVKSVRRTKKPARVDFRCDSPEYIRAMIMQIVPLEDDEIEFRNEIIHLGARKKAIPSTSFRVINKRPTSICSRCNKVHTKDHDWVELDDALENDWLGSKPFSVQFGLCPMCTKENLAKISELEQNMEVYG